MQKKKQPLTEEELRYLEEFIPDFADTAFKTAYVNSLASGNPVVIAENGFVCEVYPTGEKKRLHKFNQNPQNK